MVGYEGGGEGGEGRNSLCFLFLSYYLFCLVSISCRSVSIFFCFLSSPWRYFLDFISHCSLFFFYLSSYSYFACILSPPFFLLPRFAHPPVSHLPKTFSFLPFPFYSFLYFSRVPFGLLAFPLLLSLSLLSPPLYPAPSFRFSLAFPSLSLLRLFPFICLSLYSPLFPSQWKNRHRVSVSPLPLPPSFTLPLLFSDDSLLPSLLQHTLPFYHTPSYHPPPHLLPSFLSLPPSIASPRSPLPPPFGARDTPGSRVSPGVLPSRSRG